MKRPWLPAASMSLVLVVLCGATAALAGQEASPQQQPRPPAAPSSPSAIEARGVKASGDYSNAKDLIIDQRFLDEGAPFDDPGAVHWTDPRTFFVIDLGMVYVIEAVEHQVDNNDDYRLDVSTDGKAFGPLILVRGELGEIDDGLDRLSTAAGHPEHAARLALKPTEARYLRLAATGGDGIFAAAEVRAFGRKADPGAVPAPREPRRLEPAGIRARGAFANLEALMVDGKIPDQETPWDDGACVFWNDPATVFVIDLGTAYWVYGLTVQVDNNDDYMFEHSLDGTRFSPLITILAGWGEVQSGMETLTTVTGDPQYVLPMYFAPVQARFVSLMAREGDGSYACSEIAILGSEDAPRPPEALSGPRAPLKRLFSVVDRDQDGGLSPEEHAKVWHDDASAGESFKQFDKDGNGSIDSEEFLDLYQRLEERARARAAKEREEGARKQEGGDPPR